ncbi:MAG TPA: RebB family R body protein [Allosphingosinicella sp.]
MAYPTSVNDQITDSITQANVEVLGVSPAVAMGNLYQAVAQALANAAHNATAAQQQMYITAQAATTAGVAQIYAAAASATAADAREANIFRSKSLL